MIIRFGDFEIDKIRFELRRAGVVVPLEPRVFDLILYLADNSRRVVSKNELLAEVWAGRHVADGSLSVAISAARKALGDNATDQHAIRTCRGRGYQLALGSEPAPRAQEQLYHGDESSPGLHGDFVGRQLEMERFAETTERLRRGDPTLTLISGEPGIGKTRLLDEMLRQANRLGFVTCIGRCSESGDAPAMWPWSQVFRSLFKRTLVSPTLLATGHKARAVSMIAPELVQRSPTTATDHSLSDLTRFQLFEGLLDALDELSAGGRLVIAIEDMHRADTATLGFLQFAARELRHLPINFLVTYRAGELRVSPAHLRIFAELAREPHAVSIALRGLNESETAELFAFIAARSLSEEQASSLFQKTGGNPFFIRQLATLASASSVADAPSSGTRLPSTLQDAILEQVSFLSPNARSVLAAAAVIGRDFTYRTLSDITDLDQSDLETSVDVLVDSFVLQREQGGTDRLSFVHVLVRDALYGTLQIAERRRLHERVARSLITEHGLASAAHIAEVASHLFESYTPEGLAQARVLSEEAARSATARAAHDTAEHHLSRALSALDLTDPSNEAEQCRILLDLGTAQCRAGVRSKAKETFASAAELARSIGAKEVLAKAALGVSPGFLAVEVGVADPFLAALLQESLDDLGDEVSGLRARVAARLAMALHWTDSHSRMHDLISMATSLAHDLGDPRVSLEIDFARWFCEWHHTQLQTRESIASSIYRNAEILRNPEMTLIGTMLRQVCMLERGEITAFDLSLETFAAMAIRLREPYALWYEVLYRTMRVLLAGETPLVSDLLLRFQAIAARVQDANATNSLIMQTSFFRWETNELEPMIRWISEGSRRSPTLQAYRAAVAWANCKVGKLSECGRHFEPLASSGFANFPERFDWPISVALCSEVCSDLGDSARAQDLYDLLQPLRDQFLVLGLGVLSFGSAARLLGRLSETMGRGEEAEAYFRMAIERNAAAGAHAWTAHSKLDYAVFLARTGTESKRDYRVRLASEVFETASDLGLVSLRERAGSFLENATERRGTRRVP